jgi:hypothetical protein
MYQSNQEFKFILWSVKFVCSLGSEYDPETGGTFLLVLVVSPSSVFRSLAHASSIAREMLQA